MRVVLGVEYDGSAYHGFQKQTGLDTIQLELEKALSCVANEKISIICAGRTDVGVHALGQVIHFDTNVKRPEKAWLLGTNTYLPHDIAITWVKFMKEDFHARFSALKRHYRYIIYNQKLPSVFFRKRVTFYPWHLQEDLMLEGAKYLIGEHDFSSFRGADCQSISPYRCVENIAIKREKAFLIIDIIANAFLHHMVRNIVGSLMEVGIKKKEPQWIYELLTACDRSLAGTTASAEGLYLMQVIYPAAFGLNSITKISEILCI